MTAYILTFLVGAIGGHLVTYKGVKGRWLFWTLP